MSPVRHTTRPTPVNLDALRLAVFNDSTGSTDVQSWLRSRSPDRSMPIPESKTKAPPR